jgi:hypothetical protein
MLQVGSKLLLFERVAAAMPLAVGSWQYPTWGFSWRMFGLDCPPQPQLLKING